MTETEYRKAFGLEISEEVFDPNVTVNVSPKLRKTKIL